MNPLVDLQFTSLFSLGYISGVIPKKLTEEIEEEVVRMIKTNFIESDIYNNNLAGAIQHEYIIKNSASSIEEFMKIVVPAYWRQWGLNDTANAEHYIPIVNGRKDVWVNFQKKFEYNPVHVHGHSLSFVIWHKIPYDIEEERKVPCLKRSNTNSAGVFAFNYPNFLVKGGVSQTYLVIDKSCEGGFILFPSMLQHMVYPFYTSDDYRISLSGNLEYKT